MTSDKIVSAVNALKIVAALGGMGAGAAFLDYDQDGWLAIYLVDGFDLAHLRGTYTPVNLSYGDVRSRGHRPA